MAALVSWLPPTLRWLWLMIALAVILYAVLVSAARFMLPALDRYHTQIDALLSEHMGVPVSTQGISGEWRRLSPVLRAEKVQVGYLSGPDDTPALEMAGLRIELDLLWSALRRQVVWKDLRVGELGLRFSENAAGRWAVAGLGGQQGGDASTLLDMLFHSDRIRFPNVAVDLHFYSGSTTRVVANDVQLESSGDFHRLGGTVTLEDMSRPSRFLFEGRGRPDQLEGFSGQGHLILEELHFSGDLGGLAGQWFPEVAARIGELHSNIHMETWFEIEPGGTVRSRSLFRADRIPLNWAQDVPDAENISAELLGWLAPGEDWGVSLQGLSFEWRDRPVQPFDLQFRQQLGERWTNFSLGLNRIELDVLRPLVLETGVLPERVAGIINDLSPTGEVERLRAVFLMEEGKPLVEIRGNLREVAIDPWRDAPAARGVSGYFEAGLDWGLVEVASEDLALWYPQAYDDFMPYGQVRGRVGWNWLREESHVSVTAGPVSVEDEAGRGQVWLDLDLPVNQPGQSAGMTLMVRLLDSHSRYRDRYLPTVLPDTLREWLASAVGDADIPRADFLWRGLFRGEEHRTVQLRLALQDGELAFDPQWPALEAIDAQLYLSDVDLNVVADKAVMSGVQVDNVLVTLRDAGVGNPQLAVEADVDGRVDDVLALLRDSPVAEHLRFMDDWQADGSVSGRIDLHLPLQSLATDGRYQVEARIEGGSLNSPLLKLDFADIDGPLSFDSDSGLQSDGLAGRLWSEPIGAIIKTDGAHTMVNLNGRVRIADLPPHWWPQQSIVQGDTEIDARLAVAHGNAAARLSVTTELRGVELALPEPLGKNADSARPLAVNIELPQADASWRLDWHFDDELRGQLVLAGNRFERGVIALGRELPALPSRRSLLISAYAETADWREWWERYRSLDLPVVSDRGQRLSIPLQVDLQLDRLATGWLGLSSLHLTGAGRGDNWSFEVDAKEAKGRVLWRGGNPHPHERLTVTLDHLRLPAPAEMVSHAASAEIDPRTFPVMSLLVDDLRVGDDPWGSLGLVLASDDQGARFEQLSGEFRGLAIVNEDSEQPAALNWYFDGIQHSTSLVGQFHAEDLAAWLRELGVDSPVESERSAFNLAWAWPGKPWELKLTSLSGLLHFDLDNGVFRRSPGAATNAVIRVVGLFNFANWVRRLRLDFSDFFTEGVSFDRVAGGVMFREGELVVDRAIEARLPSGQMRMTGNVNLLAETLDMRMVTTLPISTNLPWVAAIIGGLPAAAGVYLTSLVFRSQVDRLSSISHHIEGDWDDPIVQVERIFGDTTH